MLPTGRWPESGYAFARMWNTLAEDGFLFKCPAGVAAEVNESSRPSS
jgi:hypothetical protein